MVGISKRNAISWLGSVIEQPVHLLGPFVQQNGGRQCTDAQVIS
jgi:hypothetical protein